MSTKLKIPKQFRITFKDQVESVLLNPEEKDYTKYKWCRVAGLRLGFANVYEPTTKAYASRKDTQDNWAYGYNSYEKDGVIHQKGRVWRDDPKNPTGRQIIVEVDEPYRDDLQPIIIDNVPLEGFKIQHMVSRYRGNKVWRILDPRGFELEIGSGCFEDLVMSGVVDKGVIVGACIWRTGKILQRV